MKYKIVIDFVLNKSIDFYFLHQVGIHNNNDIQFKSFFFQALKIMMESYSW